jgi:predicted AAA+ superfamily ATPase
MYRLAFDYLKQWKEKSGRKPLVIRGARQVGKSYIARQLGKETFEGMVELNFEKDPDTGELFRSNDPKKIVGLLELKTNVSIRPGNTLLFLDEIQAVPSVISVLRYFYEQIPELHILAAGSLLEFALKEPELKMPVGRIEYLHLGPMQFEEFLVACGREKLADHLRNFHLGDEQPGPIHAELMELFKSFMMLGGMPESVGIYAATGSYAQAEEVKHSIISTFKDDFSKYGSRVRHDRVKKVFEKIPALLGRRLKYSTIDRDEKAGDLSRALDLLCMARVAYRVRHSAANGIPLGAEAKDSMFKVLFLDAGLACSALGLGMLDLERAGDLLLVNSGALCEQVIGQHLLHMHPFYQEPGLFFWSREKANSSAEVDYLISEETRVVPVEVKAGKTGTLKSLQIFLQEKNSTLGVRFNSEPASVVETGTNLPGGRKSSMLLSLPMYSVGQTVRHIKEALS